MSVPCFICGKTISSEQIVNGAPYVCSDECLVKLEPQLESDEILSETHN